MSTQTFDVAFDKAPKMSEKKVVNPTIDLVKRVLKEAGLDEGAWTLKNPSRNRKKGSERFRAIRQEHWGVRVRCKPGGNDTCWEYVLNPPEGTDAGMVFDILSRVHPVRLEIPESVRLPRAFLARMAGVDDLFPKPRPKTLPQLPRPPLPLEPVQQAQDDLPAKQIEPEQPKETPRAISTSFVPARGIRETATVLSVLPIEKQTSLALFEPCLLSDEEAMDRALIALAYVSVGGFAKRIPASNSIVENLDMHKFVKEISNGTYVSINGAMRALTMALTSFGYIERIICASNSTRGYTLTRKAEKRINLLRQIFDESVFSKIKPGWSGNTESEWPSPEDDQTENQEGLEEKNLDKAFSVMDKLKEAVDQVHQVDGFLRNLESEKTDLEATKAGHEMSLSQKAEKLKELQEEIERIKGKIGEIDTQIEKKNNEIDDWKHYQEPYIIERDRLTVEVKKLVGA